MEVDVEIETVADGVHPFGDGMVNCYAVVEGGDVTLVDAAYPTSMNAIVASLGRIGRSPADVTAVLVTHGHIDHIGVAERLRSEHGSEVHGHPDEHPTLQGRRASGRSLGLALGVLPNVWRRHTWRFLAHSLSHGFLRPAGSRS
jgi:glyoxylase-like metal-dependent hydrolase (beta-lactamase superfamily II)